MLNKYGKWALITGASSGIGEEFAKRLAAKNLNLVLIARREDRLRALAENLKQKHNIEVEIISGDLTETSTITAIKEKTADKEVGLLINNAGFGSTGEFAGNDPDIESKMVMLNCVVPTILTHHFVNGMITRKRGGIIFLGSLVAFQSTPMMATYSATKVFNLSLGESLWYELRKYNIDVLALNPGGTKTEFQRIASLDNGPFVSTPQKVVDTALNALGKKPSVIDGFFNKVMAVSGKILPRKIIVQIAGKMAEKLYNAKGKQS
jgi:uncharacterized protein